MELLAGAVIVFGAAFLGGVTGFGFSLLTTPLLLLLGFPLPFVVTANMSVALFTRIPVVYRFRNHICWKRVAGLVGGCIPGLWLGAQVLTAIPEDTIKVVAGVIVMLVAIALWRSRTSAPPRPIPGSAVAAGFVGGSLGASTSLNGVGPILLLARDKASPKAFLADLGFYFVAVNALGLLVLYSEGALVEEVFYPAFVVWFPASAAGNFIGVWLAPRLPESVFRNLALTVIFVAGAMTAATAI